MVTQLQKKRLRLYKDRLNILLDLTQTINENHSVDDLVNEFEILLREELEVGKVLVFMLSDKNWNLLLASGVNAQDASLINVEKDLIPNYTTLQNITLDAPIQLTGFDAVIPLYHKYKLIGYVLIGDIDEEHSGISPTIKHLKLIQIIANLVIVFIENKRMQDELIKQETLKKEMEVASRIQAQLVPNNSQLPQSKSLEISSFYHPHLGIGGDYFDVIQLRKYITGFCIADVSGKGIPAALLMSNFQAIIRVMFTDSVNLKKLMIQLNEKVNANANNEKFITFFIGKYNTWTRKLTYVNAGHLPPLLFDAKTRQLISLHKGCIGLGMLDEIPNIEIGTISIHKGSKLLTFTDGLVELESGNAILSGTNAVEEILTNDKTISENIVEIKQMVQKQMENGFIFDDVSVMGIQFK